MLRFIVLVSCVVLINARSSFPKSPKDFHNHPSRHSRKNVAEIANDTNVCQSEMCKRTAKRILESMDKTVNPCDEFYKYTCGNWAKNHPLLPSTPSQSVWKMMSDTVQSQIRRILEDDGNGDEMLALRLAKKWYRACMNDEMRDKQGVQPLVSIISRIGGWPMAMPRNEWFEDEYTWKKVEKYYVRLSGQLTFFDYQVLDGKLFGINGILFVVKPAKVPLQDEAVIKRNRAKFYKRDDYKKLIVEVVKEIAEETGFDITEEEIDKDVEDMLAFEKKLLKLVLAEDQRNEDDNDDDGGENLVNEEDEKDNEERDESDEENGENNSEDDSKNDNGDDSEDDSENDSEDDSAPSSRLPMWKKSVETLFVESDLKMDAQSLVPGFGHGYSLEIDSLLRETSNRTLVNYIHWNFISRLIKFTSTKFDDLTFKVWANTLGIKKQKPRWKSCTQDVKMEEVVSYEYVNRYFSNETKKFAEDIISLLQEVMRQDINRSTWMANYTKTRMAEKLSNMRTFIGYPDWYSNATAVQRYYRGLIIGNKHVENVLSYMKYDWIRQMQLLKKRHVFNNWQITPITVNAIYIATQNALTITAADFQEPFYDSSYPDALAFGIIGFTLAHEISHGFDPRGRLYDKDGKIVMWSQNMDKKYQKRKDCFIGQYGNYTEILTNNSTIKLDGMKTSHENVADSIGLATAYSAYKIWTEKTGKPDKKLPGFENLSEDQLFFISFASTWCDFTRPDIVKLVVKEDPHSTPHLRVIGSVSNNKHFANTFECPEGSPMNPQNKCTIWA